ncbi:tRNA:Cm32/Um32 methyltransferase [Klebsiella pneumoniae]|uniref:tRNA (cytidine/uridine-2'-O-)-methyltransferase TrmJ n=1 Tax=Klebsiella pneumoniae TaxID=573 RepID=A0A377XM48_KLEPN|nr:tRNA:Cm32/Um32 methyltransferase [Klebsiella pneumoniae]
MVGTSGALPHAARGRCSTPRECGLKSVAEGQHAPVALVFGRERVGLTNDELQKCHYHVAIAANPEYSSLNLAMAVQVIAYEVRMAWLAAQEQAQPAVEHEEAPYRWWTIWSDSTTILSRRCWRRALSARIIRGR